MTKRKSCKSKPSMVELAEDGTASSVVSLQPVVNNIPSWKKFMSDWHLDKRVPISLIIMIMVQSASAIWWASSVEAKIIEQQKASDIMTAYITKQTDNDKRTIEILARLDERVRQQSEMLATIDRKVNK
jgi:hypothetical protein